MLCLVWVIENTVDPSDFVHFGLCTFEQLVFSIRIQNKCSDFASLSQKRKHEPYDFFLSNFSSTIVITNDCLFEWRYYNKVWSQHVSCSLLLADLLREFNMWNCTIVSEEKDVIKSVQIAKVLKKQWPSLIFSGSIFLNKILSKDPESSRTN